MLEVKPVTTVPSHLLLRGRLTLPIIFYTFTANSACEMFSFCSFCQAKKNSAYITTNWTAPP